MGEIYVDDGAANALMKGKSLLPAGATEVKGNFERGDLVTIRGKNGEIARGLCSYSSEDACKIIRKKSSEIEKILGYSGQEELLHRDDMVITLKN
jgi:glutamate 5-kinase